MGDIKGNWLSKHLPCNTTVVLQTQVSFMRRHLFYPHIRVVISSVACVYNVILAFLHSHINACSSCLCAAILNWSHDLEMKARQDNSETQ